MLITDLSNVKSIQIVEREKLESLLKEIGLGESKFMDESSAQKLGKGLGAGYILTGSYFIMGETMRIDARLVDVGTGKVSMGEEITGKKNIFFELEKQLVEKLIVTLNLELSRTEERNIKKVQTESFDSFNAYSKALNANDNEDFDKVKKYLEESISFDPNYERAKIKLNEIEEWLEKQVILKKEKFNERYPDLLTSLNPNSADFLIEINNIIFDALNSNNYQKCFEIIDWLKTLDLIIFSQYEDRYGEGGQFSMAYFEWLEILFTSNEKNNQKVIELSQLWIKKYPNNTYYFLGVSQTLDYTLKASKTKLETTKKITSDPIVEIRMYAKLRDDGIITEEEFQAKKKELLGL